MTTEPFTSVRRGRRVVVLRCGGLVTCRARRVIGMPYGRAAADVTDAELEQWLAADPRFAGWMIAPPHVMCDECCRAVGP